MGCQQCVHCDCIQLHTDNVHRTAVPDEQIVGTEVICASNIMVLCIHIRMLFDYLFTE
jgi:hypothetical protein